MVSYLFVLYQHPLAEIALFEVTTPSRCYLLIFLPPGDHTTILEHITPDAFLLEHDHSASSTPSVPSPLRARALTDAKTTTSTPPVFFFTSTQHAPPSAPENPEYAELPHATDEARLLACVQSIILSLTHDAYWSLTPPYHVRAVEYAHLFSTQNNGGMLA
jgi:hypothetical protein